MAKPLKKVTAGEPFQPSTALQNATVDVIRYVRELQASGGAGPGGQPTDGGIVQVKNNSGVDRNRFDVLGIDDVFPTPTGNLNAFKAGPVLQGITPATASHLGKFAILLAPAKTGVIVPAVVAGVGVAKVNVNHASHTCADVKDGDAGSLDSYQDGAAGILWIESGLGVKWAVVELGPRRTYHLRFELKTDLAIDGSATAYLRYWDSAASTWTTDTGTTFTVYDAMSEFNGVGRDTAGGTVGGDFGYAVKLPDCPRWEVIQLGC